MMEKYLFVILTVAASVYAATAPAYAAQIAGYKPYGFLKTNKKARNFVVKYIADFTAFFDRSRFDVCRIFRRFGAEK